MFISKRATVIALFALSIGFLVGQSSAAAATIPVPASFRTIRAVVQYNGVPGSVQTATYGGAGMTITDDGRGGQGFLVDFPVGTWTNPKTSKQCYFVPTISGINNTGGVILSVVENADGSGTMVVSPGGTLPITMIIESANC